MSADVYDAIVIGGGPAGCGAAIALARMGARVALFEARRYPHDKLCGEFLSPDGVALLARLGAADDVRALGPVSITQAMVTAPDGTRWETRFPAPGWGLTRRALDAALAAHARALGVHVCEGATVTAVTGGLRRGFAVAWRDGDGVQTVQARAVLAAHGKRAALDRALARPFLQRRQPWLALKAHFHGPPLPGRIALHGFAGGYCGMSETEDGRANVCLLVHEDVFRRSGAPGPQAVPTFIRWMQAQNRHLGGWLAQARQADADWMSIAQIPFAAKSAVAGDVLMVGDAAGVIMPLAGDGMAMALRSGEMAAAHVAAFLAGRLAADDLPRRYAAAWRREFAGRLRLARLLQSLMLRPHTLALGLRLLAAVPPLGRYVVAHTRDVRMLQPTREGNAWG